MKPPPAADLYERPLGAEEFSKLVDETLAMLNGPEGETIAGQIAWFLRRYPDPLDRIRYCRRKYVEAERLRGLALKSLGSKAGCEDL